jgi:hypothetical protein
MTRAYLTYVLIHDIKAPPVIGFQEFPDRGFAESVGRGMEKMLAKATEVHKRMMWFYWCVTTNQSS